MFGNLLQGAKIALFLKLDVSKFRYSPALFWLIALLTASVAFAFDYFQTDEPRMFYWEGFTSEAFHLLIVVLLGYLLSLVVKQPLLQFRFPTLFLNAGFWPWLFYKLIQPVLLEAYAEGLDHYFWIGYGVLVGWTLAITWRILSSFGTAMLWLRNGIGAVLTCLLIFMPGFWIYFYPYWSTDYQAAEDFEPQAPELDAEKILSEQTLMLDGSLADIQASKPGKVDLFWLGYAGWGEQNVFANEVKRFQELFDRQFGTSRQSIKLINNPETVAETPLATGTNLRRALSLLAGKMQPEEDILFLFLTSHGTEDHYLATTLYNLPLNDLGADTLAEILHELPVRHKVIVVSACYSGGFIPVLKDPNHLVITAAHAKRTSFGCSDDAEFTYFGRAYFLEALRQTKNFVEAFDLAKSTVQVWEEQQEFVHSDPQIAIGSEIELKLLEWQNSLSNHIRMAQDATDIELQQGGSCTTC